MRRLRFGRSCPGWAADWGSCGIPPPSWRISGPSWGTLFALDAFGHRLFCVFSPDGVRSLYAQPEEEASFGLATYTLIKAKVPIELLLGRRNHPKSLFGNAKGRDLFGHPARCGGPGDRSAWPQRSFRGLRRNAPPRSPSGSGLGQSWCGAESARRRPTSSGSFRSSMPSTVPSPSCGLTATSSRGPPRSGAERRAMAATSRDPGGDFCGAGQAAAGRRLLAADIRLLCRRLTRRAPDRRRPRRHRHPHGSSQSTTCTAAHWLGPSSMWCCATRK